MLTIYQIFYCQSASIIVLFHIAKIQLDVIFRQKNGIFDNYVSTT